jgi:hypothetical protein
MNSPWTGFNFRTWDCPKRSRSRWSRGPRPRRDKRGTESSRLQADGDPHFISENLEICLGKPEDLIFRGPAQRRQNRIEHHFRKLVDAIDRLVTTSQVVEHVPVRDRSGFHEGESDIQDAVQGASAARWLGRPIGNGKIQNSSVGIV